MLCDCGCGRCDEVDTMSNESKGIHCTEDRRATLTCRNSKPAGVDRFAVSASRLRIIARLCGALKAHPPPPSTRTIPSIDINLRFNKLIRYIGAEALAACCRAVISQSRRRRDYEMRYDVPDPIHV